MQRALAALLLLGLAVPASAAAPAGGAACSGCHAPTATADGPPPLVGRPAGEIAEAMAAFRAGTRPATVMDRIAKGFTPEESAAIADWLAAGAK